MTDMDSGSTPGILVVGYNAFDVIVPVGDLPRPDEKLQVPGIISGGGGPGATAAVALARLGARVRLMTPLTDDVFGRIQRDELESAGVDLGLCPLIKGRASPQAVILVDEVRGHRTILWSRGDLPGLPARLADPQLVDGVDLLYTDGHEGEVSIRLAGAARDRGVPVVMDAGSVRAWSSRLVGCCTDVVSSQGFAPVLTGCPAPLEALRALRDLGPRQVAMTFGRDGVLGLADDRLVAVPAFDVPVIDTTGAGDAFHAGYAFARAVGLEFLDCLDWGCAVAGLKCRDWGGRRGLPSLSEARALLKSGRRVPRDPILARGGC